MEAKKLSRISHWLKKIARHEKVGEKANKRLKAMSKKSEGERLSLITDLLSKKIIKENKV